MALTQDPNDVLDYTASWDAVLEAGEAILTSEWSGDMTATNPSSAARTTTAFLSGGSVGSNTVTNRITTDQGRTYERSFQVTVREL